MRKVYMLLDFTPHGWKAAIKEFTLSVLKTMLSAGVAYVIARLAEYNVPTDSAHAAELIAGVGLLRAALTSLYAWVTTSKATVVPAVEVVG